jgi:hypothetical protein
MSDQQASRKPNLFLVGPPKCGTTAISEYLLSHPDVFFSNPKEPGHFCADIKQDDHPFKTLDAYLALFANANNKRFIAEGSTSYIVSSVAIERILDFNPDARFIAFVRNPIDQCRSLHLQLINSQQENVLEFESAWRLQEHRAEGRCLPPGCRNPAMLQYRLVASMGTLLRRFMGQVPHDQRHVIVYDDFKTDPEQVYAEVLAFLGLPHDGRSDFPVINQAHTFHLPGVMRTLRRPPKLLRRSAQVARRFNRGRSLGIFRTLDRMLSLGLRHNFPIAVLTPRMHAELVDTFQDEVALLSELLNRDLSSWLEPCR